MTQRRRTHPLAGTALIVIALAGGCSAKPAAVVDDPQDVKAIKSAAAAQNALPVCKEVFVPGKVIDAKKAAAGCKDAHGQVHLLGVFTCADGRALYSVDADTGAPAGWGYGGGKFHAAKDPAADPGYGKAYDACNG